MDREVDLWLFDQELCTLHKIVSCMQITQVITETQARTHFTLVIVWLNHMFLACKALNDVSEGKEQRIFLTAVFQTIEPKGACTLSQGSKSGSVLTALGIFFYA